MTVRRLWFLSTVGLLTSMVVASASGQQPAAQSGQPRKPLLVLKHFGGEGRKVLAAARNARSFPLYKEPGGREVAARVSLVKNRKLDFDDVRMLIYGFGEAEILPTKTEHEINPTFLTDGVFTVNTGPEKVKFAQGEKLELLAYISEGWHVARYKGRDIQINAEDLKILRWEDAETWVRFKDIAGKSGWAKVDTENIKIAGLEF
jgi:hypothetical protein